MHTDEVVEFPPVHWYPLYTWQTEEHPSPSTTFPSSQGSVNNKPSPHIYIHILAFVMLPPLQLKPVSREHVEEQPSPFIRLPSSQGNVKRIPSPQI